MPRGFMTWGELKAFALKNEVADTTPIVVSRPDHNYGRAHVSMADVAFDDGEMYEPGGDEEPSQLGKAILVG